MPDKEKQSNNSKYFNKKSITITAVILLFMIILSSTTQFSIIELFRPGTKIERVRKKFKESLYEQYGKEFVVYGIGTRTYNDRKMWEAQIYPKEYVGTPKEDDPYYKATAGMDIKPFGGLGSVGGGWENVQIKIEAEKYIESKVKEIFGKKVLIKSEVKYKRKDEENEYFGWKIVSGFDSLLTKANQNPNKHRIELQLYLYIFDRIDSKQEKEKRRKDIFEFVQYLKKEGLFRYLEMGVYLIDERVLAPSYEEYIDKIYNQKWIEKEISGESIELPPKDFRKKMSQALQSEIDTMNKKQLIENMNKIKKCELTYEDLRKENNHYFSVVYSKKMLKDYYGANESNKLMKDYENIENVVLTNNLEYIYINQGGY